MIFEKSLSQEEIATLNQKGFLLLEPGRINRTFLENVEKEFRTLLPDDGRPNARYEGLPLKYRSFFAGRGSKLPPGEKNEYGKIVTLPDSHWSPSLLNFIQGQCEQVLAQTQFSTPHWNKGEFCQIHPDWTGTDKKFKVEQTKTPLTKLVIYLSDFDDQSPLLKVVPGSHLFSQTLMNSEQTLYEELLPESIGKPVPLKGKKGTILILNGHLLYSIEPNKSQETVQMLASLSFSSQTLESLPMARKKNNRVKKLLAKLSPQRYLRYAKSRVWYPILRKFNHPELRINLGAGPGWRHPKFLGLDCYGAADIKHNIAENVPLPFSSESLTVLYTSHCIEHMLPDTVDYLFKECFRCLKPGGILRITCPDMDTFFDAYEKKDLAWFDWIRNKGLYAYDSWLRLIVRNFADAVVDHFSDEQLYSLYNRLNRVEFMECFSKELSKLDKSVLLSEPNGHKTWWTKNKLTSTLKKYGFSTVTATPRHRSRCADLRDTRFFDNTHPKMSLYVEAIK